MADSSITKKALSQALIDLMKEEPFQKISVADICGKCSMNRKSFYYHFKDKYDLVNWIFDNDFIAVVQQEKEKTLWESLLAMFNRFYQNREFYYHALTIQGQNSLSDHIREVVEPILQTQLRDIMEGEVTSLQINLVTDGILAALLRWLRDKNCMPPEEYLPMLKTCVLRLSNHVQQIYAEEESMAQRNEPLS